jgi:hypothetical protein
MPLDRSTSPADMTPVIGEVIAKIAAFNLYRHAVNAK